MKTGDEVIFIGEYHPIIKYREKIILGTEREPDASGSRRFKFKTGPTYSHEYETFIVHINETLPKEIWDSPLYKIMSELDDN